MIVIATKDGVSETQIENLQDKIYRGIDVSYDISRLTRKLGDKIAEVYGW